MRYDWYVNKARRTLETRLREDGQAVSGQNEETMSHNEQHSAHVLHQASFDFIWTNLKSLRRARRASIVCLACCVSRYLFGQLSFSVLEPLLKLMAKHDEAPGTALIFAWLRLLRLQCLAISCNILQYLSCNCICTL